MKVRLRVTLSKPVTGQMIFDTVKQMAGDYCFENELLTVTDDDCGYLIGKRNPSRSFGDVVIGVGSEFSSEINLKSTYDQVFVLSWKFPGMEEYDSNDSIIKAVREFRDNLQVHLNNLP